MQTNPLLRPDPPHLHVLVADPSTTCDWMWSLRDMPGKQVITRAVRGQKALTSQEFFNECAAALQFPYYFGENWDALRDCLADLQWLTGDAYVIIVTQSDRLLAREPAELRTFCEVLTTVADEWRTQRPPRPFHVVIQCVAEHEAELKGRLEQAGATTAMVTVPDTVAATQVHGKPKSKR